MKKIALNILGILILTVCLVSCEDQLDINRDPDNLPDTGIQPATEFPAAIIGIVGAQGTNGALIGGFWSQYWTQSNSANQYKTIDDYSILGTSATINGYWANMYDALGDARNVKKIAEEEGNWNYYLAATVLEVYASQELADFFGQIPYEEANNPQILQPYYNAGEDVYDLMIEDLDNALSKNLGSSQGNAPGNDDLLFEGDMNQWVAFANTLKLKIYLRQENARPSIAESGITELLTSGAPFLNTDASFSGFEDAPSKSNPLYESNERQLNVATNLRASTTLYSYLSTNADPRLPFYYEDGNPLDQGDYNSSAGASSISVVNLHPETPYYFISREESLFMQAEAQLKYGNPATAEQNYNAAVSENFSKYKDGDGNSLDASSYIAAGGAYEYPAAGSQDDQLKAIIMQKWVSGFPGNGFESFFDTNRTGIPETSTVPQSDASYVPGTLSYSVNGTTGGDFPKRLPFSSDSQARNENAPATIEITAPVWWAE